MKLSPRDAPRYFARPDPNAAGLLIHGTDTMRIALRRQEVIAALVGPQGETEMRLTRIAAGDLRRDPARLLDAVKAQGFFPGPRVAFVEEAGDGLADTIATALGEWRPGDAQIVVTAGSLNARSKLRKLFEGHGSAYAAGVYDEPMGRTEIEAELARAGLSDIPRDAGEALAALARQIEPGDFRQTLEKLVLYKMSDDTPLGPADVAALAPASTEADMDDAVHAAAEGRDGEIGPIMQRLAAQGATPVGLVIAAARHFRALYAIASAPGGPSEGAARLRPPVFGPRRDRMVRQAQRWGAPRLDEGLGMIVDTDLALRSAGQTAPAMALVERLLIRLARLGAR